MNTITRELLEKAYKYIRRWKKGEKWEYEYPHLKTDTSGKLRVHEKYRIAAKTKRIDYIKPIEPTEENIHAAFSKLRQLSKEGKLRVKAYGNFPVFINKMSVNHLYETKRQQRDTSTIDERARLLPFVAEILNNTGKLGEISRRKGTVTYGIIGRVAFDGKEKVVEISLGYDKKAHLFFLSNYEIEKAENLKGYHWEKSLSQFVSAFSFFKNGVFLQPTVKGNAFAHGQFDDAPLSFISILDSHDLSTEDDGGQIQKALQNARLFVPLKLPPTILVDIENITEDNKKEKLKKAAAALAYVLDIPLELNGEVLEKAKMPKYLSKKFVNGKWQYTYDDDRKTARAKVELCTAKPLHIGDRNVRSVAKEFIESWRQDWQQNPEKRKCPALNYTKISIAEISFVHFYKKRKGRYRSTEDLNTRARLLPLAKEILEGKNKGIVNEVRVDEEKKLVYYEIIGRANIHGKEETISVIVSKFKPDAKKYISVIKKSCPPQLHWDSLSIIADDGSQPCNYAEEDILHDNEAYHLAYSHHYPMQPDTSVAHGDKKSKYISVIKKALRFAGLNVPLSRQDTSRLRDTLHTTTFHATNTTIPQISAESKQYPNIILDIQGITEDNKLEKFCKAVRLTAKQLQLPVGIERDEKAGEKHLYPIKQELCDVWTSMYDELLGALYIAITDILGLPSVSVETMRKSFNAAEHPRGDGGLFVKKGSEESKTTRRKRIAQKSVLISDIEPIQASDSDILSKGKEYIRSLEELFKQDNRGKCKAIQNRQVVFKKISHTHLFTSNGSHRDMEEIKKRIRVLPFIPRIIEDTGLLCKIAKSSRTGLNDYEIVGRAKIKDEEYSISIILTDDAKKDLLYLSIFSVKLNENVSKALTSGSCREPACEVPRLLVSSICQRHRHSYNHADYIPYLDESSIIQKSLSDSALKKLLGNLKLRYKGKIIYNPETGEPIKKKDFDRLIRAIEGVMNMHTQDTAKQMTLDSVTIGKLLRRMAQYQSTDALEKLKLDALKYKGKSFDWIKKDYAHLASALGTPLSRAETARYQVCEDYAAQLITRVNDDVRNDVKSVLLWGIQNKKSRSEVSQELFNRFGAHNRSWKRIVDTEMVNTANLASILEEVHQAEDGEKVYFQRHEMAGACPFCAKVAGVIALWSDTPLADDTIKDPYASVAIWEGKEPGKNVLVPGALHPHCRGFWVRWGADEFNASAAKLNGKDKEWNAAVGKAREEYKKRGIESPNDGTKGYVKRINALYREA